jgi:hypothetical protein
VNPFNFPTTGFTLTELGEHALDEIIHPDFHSGEIITAGLTMVDGARTSVSPQGPASIGIYGTLAFAGRIPTVTVTRPRFRVRRKNRAPIKIIVDKLGQYHWAAEVSGPKPYTVHVSTPSQNWKRHLA